MTYPPISKTRALLKASHFGPTVLVVTITFFIALSQMGFISATRIAFAIFLGQLVVGWSNEVIDFPLDKAANRTQKPLVSGELSKNLLIRLIPIALLSATLFSFLSPLGLLGTLLHLLGILSATLYNLRLKATIFSPLPYFLSFSALPWAIFLAAENNPPPWLYLGLGTFSVSFHFLNVLKDLEWDQNQKVLGLPQRLGKRKSMMAAISLSVTGFLIVIFLR